MPATVPTAASSALSDAASRHTVIASDGARLAAYVHEAHHPDAPTVVLAHGWTLTHRSWHRVVDELRAEADLRVVLWDQRGHGESTLAGGTHRSRGESIGRLGEDLREVIAALVPPTSPLVLAGHSMGGMTVMAYVGAATDQEIDRLDGVVFCSTAAGGLRGAGLPGEAKLMRALSRLPFRARPGRLIRDNRQREYLFGVDPRDEDVALSSALTGQVSLISYGAFYGALMKHDEVAALARLANTPTTVLVGGRDKLTPKVLAHRIHEAMPHAQLRLLPDRGHMVLLEEPEAVAGAVLEKFTPPSTPPFSASGS